MIKTRSQILAELLQNNKSYNMGQRLLQQGMRQAYTPGQAAGNSLTTLAGYLASNKGEQQAKKQADAKTLEMARLLSNNGFNVPQGVDPGMALPIIQAKANMDLAKQGQQFAQDRFKYQQGVDAQNFALQQARLDQSQNNADRNYALASEKAGRERMVEVFDPVKQANVFMPESQASGMQSAKDQNTNGKYYVVPTAQGQMLVDKGTGMAQMLGVGEDGSPVRIGQPFYPAEDSNGRPTALPANINVAELPDAGNPQPQQAAKPLMTPAADPQTQYEVTSARERAKMDIEQPEKAQKARQTMQSLERQWDVVDSTIDQVMASLDGTTAGFFGSMIGVVPGTDAYDVDKQIDTIKANIGFDRLQEMRENSPTGGALGAVSELELKLLQSVKGSLDQGQSPEQLKANLADIKRNLAALRQERQKAFAADYGAGDVGESLNKENSSPIPGNQLLSESEPGFTPAGEAVPMSDIVREARKRGLIR